MAPNPMREVLSKEYPVYNISWDEAKQFCDKVKLCLPTEAQWEYACKANTDTKFFWGNQTNSYEKYASVCDNSQFKVKPTQSYQPNYYGLYDMLGNVSEWCLDIYEHYPSTPQDNPQGGTPSDWNNKRVVRGGSCEEYISSISNTKRFYFTESHIAKIGLRPVFTVK
jgi:formylglycine-generating enzyme required for sulfatase activity